MENALSLDDVIEANTKLSDALEEFGPKMKSISEQYQDWVENPPEEVTVVMERYMIASGKFAQGLQKAVQYANDNMDNHAMQDSFRRLNLIIYNMGD